MPVSSIDSVGNWDLPRAAAAGAQPIDRRQMVQATKTVNESGLLGRNQLVFSVDSKTHQPIIRVEDRETHEVVLQIPPEYVVRLAQDLRAGGPVTMPNLADT